MYPKYKTADWAWLLVTLLCSVAATSFYTDKSDRTDYTSSFCFCSQATTILLPLPLSSRECCVVAGVEWTWNIREREGEKEEWWGVRGGRRRRTEERTETEFVRELLRVKHSLISISLSLSLSLSLSSRQPFQTYTQQLQQQSIVWFSPLNRFISEPVLFIKTTRV